MKIYNIAVEKFVPRGGAGGRKGKEWFNAKCRSAINDKINAWNRWSKPKTENRWDEYIKTRNNYVQIIRMERRKYERNVIDKCIDEHKLFYKHINGKMKHREGITKLKVKEAVYEQAQDVAEVMNEHLDQCSLWRESWSL